MKRLDFFRRTVMLLSGMTLYFLPSCTKDPATITEENLMTTHSVTLCKTETTCLWAGQTINAGSVVISNDATNLYITVNATEGFQNTTENVKIWVGNNLDLLPRAGNNAPIPGQFPFKGTASGTTFTMTIPFSGIDSYSGSAITCDNSFLYVYVHSDVIAGGGAQTAWGGCTAGTDSPRWYFSTTYTTACCSTPPPANCFSQTAFAKGGWIFTTDKKSNPENLPSLGLTKNRWGWAINLRTPGTTSYPIYAGAGLNTISKGTLVGTLTVSWDGALVTVAYQMNSGFTLTETHVYAGDLKPTTIAPGQYGNTTGFNPPAGTSTGTYAASDTNGDGIWIIAHAGVRGWCTQ